MSNPEVPGFIRAPELAKELAIGESTLWRWSQKRKFPAPLRLSPRVTAWRVSDVNDWLDKKRIPND